MYEVVLRIIISRGFSEGLELSPKSKSKLECLRNPGDKAKGHLQDIVEDLLTYMQSLIHLYKEPLIIFERWIALWQGFGSALWTWLKS